MLSFLTCRHELATELLYPSSASESSKLTGGDFSVQALASHLTSAFFLLRVLAIAKAPIKTINKAMRKININKYFPAGEDASA
jgi:hypothetical protein